MGVLARTYIPAIFIFIKFAIVSHPVFGNGSDEVNTTFGDDEDISEVNNITSTELRDVYRYYRYAKRNLEPVMGYVIFDCSMNQMKIDLKSVWPECASSYSFRSFTRNVMTQAHIEKLQPIMHAFLNLEAGHPIRQEDGAKKNIPIYFKFMYACLTRCRNFNYSNFLTNKGLAQAQSLRQLVLELNELTENDSEAAKDAAFLEFTLSYAKLRHACNGYHHTYSIEIQYSYNASLLELMYSMGLLSVWDFHTEDMKYINGIRSAFRPPKSMILTSPYNFEAINNVGQKVIISGFLPHIDIKYCPRLPFSLKFNC